MNKIQEWLKNNRNLLHLLINRNKLKKTISLKETSPCG
jgi:hypothetical protein